MCGDDSSLLIFLFCHTHTHRNYNDPSPTSVDPFPPKFSHVLATTNTEWDFRWIPDAVVINLGTNDFSTQPSPSEAAYESGKILTYYPLWLALVRPTHLPLLRNLHLGYEALVRTVRTKYSSNPNLQVFLACGPMSTGTPQCSYVQNVVSRAGGNIHFIDLQNLMTDPNTQAGCDWHPNVRSSARFTAALTSVPS